MDPIFQSLQTVIDHYDELNEQLADPEVMNNGQHYMKLSKEAGEIRQTVEVYTRYKQVIQDIQDAEELLGDAEMAPLAKEDLSALKPEKEQLEEQLKILMLPKDPNDDKTLLWKYVGQLVEMSHHCLLRTCWICIDVMLNVKIGQ